MTMKIKVKRIALGTGVLTWPAIERRTDRYGSVYLIPDGSTSLTMDNPDSLVRVNAEDGCHGTLKVKVLDARDSTHIGDLSNGVFPQTPKKGAIITLGTGTLKIADMRGIGGKSVELHPDDGRTVMWMDIVALYRAHEQLVELYFEQD